MILQTPGTTAFAAVQEQNTESYKAGGQVQSKEADSGQQESSKQEGITGEQQEVPKQEEATGEQQEVPKREEPAGEQQEVPKREEASGGQPEASTQEGTTGEQAGEAKQEETPGEQTGAKAGQSNSQESLKSPEAQKEDGTLPADGSIVQKGRLHLSLIYSLPYSAPETLNSGLQAVLTREGQQLEASFSMLEGESV